MDQTKSAQTKKRKYFPILLFLFALCLLVNIFPIKQEGLNALSNLAVTQYTQGNRTSALKTVEQITNKFPGPESFISLSQTFYQAGFRAMAIDMMIQCLKLYPNDPEALLTYGELQAKEGNLQEATAAWKKGASLNPNDKRFLENLDKTKNLSPKQPNTSK